MSQKSLTYLPLGDSYTIGTGASQKEAWPQLLSNHLNEKGINMSLPVNPARNGYTSADLINEELPLLKTMKPDFVSVLIGVNDWVQGVSKAAYAKNLTIILDELQKNMADKKRILLITIPDFGASPAGKNYAGGRNIGEGISEFNAVIKEEGKKRGLVVADIFELSKEMGKDASLVAGDGLHPSAKEYARWETLILPEAIKVLK